MKKKNYAKDIYYTHEEYNMIKFFGFNKGFDEKKRKIVFSVEDKKKYKKIYVDNYLKNKKEKDKKRKFSTKDLKKNCIDKILSYNLHIAGLERFCVNEMQFFVSVVKQNTCIIDLKFFWYNFIRAVSFLQLVSSQKKKVFFLGLPLGIEEPFMQLLKKLDETHLLKSYLIKKDITGILTNFKKLKFKQKLEGVTFVPKKRLPKIKEKKKKRLLKSKKVKLKFRKLDFKIKPFLIFVFQPLEHINSLEKLSALNVPIMGFVNTSDPMSWYDFPIPGNTNSLKGSLFVYNLFSVLFRFLPNKSNLKGLKTKITKPKVNFVGKVNKKVEKIPSIPYFNKNIGNLHQYQYVNTRHMVEWRDPGRRSARK